MLSLVRSASPYWNITYSNAEVPGAVARVQRNLPYNIQSKVDKIEVNITNTTEAPRALVSFKALTVNEIQNPLFTDANVFYVWLGWYDYTALSVSKYLVAEGSIDKAETSYEKDGITLNLVLKCSGASLIDQPFVNGYDFDKLKDLGLVGIMKHIAALGGMDCVFRGTSMQDLIMDEEIDNAKHKPKSSVITPITAWLSKKTTDPTATVDKEEKYYCPWLDFFHGVNSSKTQVTVNDVTYAYTPHGLLKYLAGVYHFEARVSGKYIVIQVMDHPERIRTATPQRFFSYRGGNDASLMASSVLDQYKIIKEDPYEKFTVISKARISDGNVAHVTPEGVQSTSAESGNKYNIMGVGPDFNSIGLDADREAARVAWNAYMARMEKARLAQGKAKDSKVIYYEGMKTKTVKFMLDALSNAKALGQIAKISGALGAPDVPIGMYFYFVGKPRDTGFYAIQEIRHLFTRNGGFKTDFVGILITDPENPVYAIPQQKVQTARAYGYYMRMRTGAELKSQPIRYTSADKTGLYTVKGYNDWSEVVKKEGLIPGIHYRLCLISEAEHSKAVMNDKLLRAQGRATGGSPCTEADLTPAEKKFLADENNKRALTEEYLARVNPKRQ